MIGLEKRELETEAGVIKTDEVIVIIDETVAWEDVDVILWCLRNKPGAILSSKYSIAIEEMSRNSYLNIIKNIEIHYGSGAQLSTTYLPNYNVLINKLIITVVIR